MDLTALPAIGWTCQRCPECRYEAVGQSRKAVLESVMEHVLWMQVQAGHQHQEMAWARVMDLKPQTRKASA